MKEKTKDPEAQEGSSDRLGICIPLYGTVTAQWLIEYQRLVLHLMKNYKVFIFMHEQQPVSTTRNKLVEMALEKGCTHIVWLDSDNTLSEQGFDTLWKNLKDHDADLVTGLYFNKEAPHYPVIREWKYGSFHKIENPGLGQLIKVDGCGYGCLVMKADVFKKIKKPWFLFSPERIGRRDIILSEDLYMSRSMREAGMSMICNTSVVSYHIGSTVGAMEYMNFANIRQENMDERNALIHDIAEFTKRTEEDVTNDMMIGPALIKEEWEEKDPKTLEEEIKFYKETKNYIYDLALWHFGNRRRFDIELKTKLARIKQGLEQDGQRLRLLDFGAGIGINAAHMAQMGYDVTVAELDSKTLEFLEFRFKKNKLEYKKWVTDQEDMPPEEKYDVIITFDCFEHMPGKEMKKYADKIRKVMHKDTEIIMSNTFTKDAGGPNSHPMHHDMDPEHQEAIETLLKQKPQV